ncbi:cysteine synthase A [Helcococcus kunzii]|uniref:cysteine synthase n=1 Tax=Helcococcus kunzii ATCC 51366 TaxID=883114 RepID=H3NM87_9FIRM|nr:cysteine synthase A [Helcococcus kunzii]EHR35496.1 cysteine synthase A [Helcococcus kunzii ATCC 51366]QZO76815.1 cysteine synthase A [Helcococcus kunzii]
MIYKNIIETIGNTPLVQLKTNDDEAEIYVKVESFNPSASIKDRPVKYILKNLMDERKLKKGDTVVEQTSGNTGIGLSMAGAALGLNIVIVMPESMSMERRQLMKAYGAELVLTDKSLGMQGAKDKANEIAKERNAIVFGQFTNPANVKSHEETTAIEILEDLPEVDGFVAGVGTGGTVTGVSKVLKNKLDNVTIWAVEPKDSPLLSEGKAGSHKIQGIGANFVPEIFSGDNIDEYFLVGNEESMEESVRLAREEGILCGISSGANVVAAKALAKKLGKGKKVVTVLPDTGERYLKQGLFD